MTGLPITETLHAAAPEQWRSWLVTHHASASEIWLILIGNKAPTPGLRYIEAVEEALCFGWIDGIAKKTAGGQLAQRFTPRRPKSNWTELNKLRARRLIEQGRMTAAGFAVLPHLDPAAFRVAPDILQALQEDDLTWRSFLAFPDDYKRIRIGYVEEARRMPDVFRTRLRNFIKNTHANKQFGVLQ